MGEIPNKVKENVRAVLLSKTDGKGVLTTDFLRDYKSILREPLMFKSLGYSTLKDFLNAIPDVCRLEYKEDVMAFKMFGIAKPNTYASSFMKKAEGNNDDDDDEEREERGGRRRGRTGGTARIGELLSLGKDLNEDWQPNCRGLYTLCFPNRFPNLSSSEEVTVKFSEVGEVADVNIIPKCKLWKVQKFLQSYYRCRLSLYAGDRVWLIFVRFRDCEAAKQAIVLWGDELRLRRADEKQPAPPKRDGGGHGGDRGGGRSRGDKDEMLVSSRQRRNDRGGNSGKKYDSEYESDYGGKSARRNGLSTSDTGKKESIWAKVRQDEREQSKEGEKTEIGAGVIEKEQFDSNQNHIIENDLVKNIQNCIQETQDGACFDKQELTNRGLLGRTPEDKNSQLLDSIAQPGKGLLGEGPGEPRSMNGLLTAPMATVPLGRAAILGRQATGHSSYVNPGPISRPSAGSINQSQPQKTSPGIQQEQSKAKLSPSAISPVTPSVVDTRKPAAISPRDDPQRTGAEKMTVERAEKEDACYKCGQTGHIRRDCPTRDEKVIQVYIGNFPYTASQEDLQDLIKQYNYKSCRIVSCKNKVHKKYAFVDFVSQTEADLCIKEMNLTEFQSRNLQVRLGSRKSEDEKEGMKVSPKPSQQPSPSIHTPPKLQPSPNIHTPEKFMEQDDDDDEMPELETNTPMITRTIKNDKYEDKKVDHKPGAFVQKSPDKPGAYLQESPDKIPHLEQKSPDKMPPLEQVSPISPASPRMPPLEQRSPPKRRTPLLPTPKVPQMPQPGTAKVFDSRDLEEKMLHNEKEEADESVQLVLTNFPYGTQESELFELFKEQTVHQVNMMNSNVTNRSTYAFVTVQNLQEAQLAILQLDQSLMKGRRLTVGMVTPTTTKKTSVADPIARITCTVGAQGDAGRRVSLDKSSYASAYMPDTHGDHLPHRGHMTDQGYHTDRGHMTGYQSDGYQSEGGFYGYRSEGSYAQSDFEGSNFDRPRHTMQEDHRKTNMRLTHILKSYAMITSKLHGEQDFMQPPNSQMTVHVTHVEENGYFFWGQVLVDETYGPRKNIETLKRITYELQDSQSRPGPLRRLGRCAALYQGQWYRAWNLGVFEDGMNDILYLDYGNSEQVPDEELCETVPEIWNIPPIVKPFRAADAVKTKYGSMKGLENKNVIIELIKPGDSQCNFVASVHLIDVEEVQ